MRRRLRNAFLLGIVVGLVVAVVRALRADPPPAVGTGARSLPGPTPALRPSRTDAGAVEDRSSGGEATDTPVAADPAIDAVADEVVVPVTADPLPDPPPPVTAPSAATPPTSAEAWVSPVEGSCPEGYPIKAKVGSRIFHVPDGTFYARTVPDRCYPTAAAAEADGFRPSKR